MKVSVAGNGYVSLTISACLAEMGNIVTHLTDDPDILTGKLSFYEPGLSSMIESNTSARRLTVTSSLADALTDVDVFFLALGYTQDVDSRVHALASDIAATARSSFVVVNCSPTSPGVTDKIAADMKAKSAGFSLPVVFNPLFLKEGGAIDDLMSPDRIILGVADHEARNRMMELYRPFMRQHERITVMGVLDAELTRFAASAMLATRISLMNEIAAIAEITGADIENVRKGIGSDSRIGYSYLYPGVGYGGFCLPGDIATLTASAAGSAVDPVLLKAVAHRNTLQQQWALNTLKSVIGPVAGKKIAIWGLSFRPETSDVAGSSAIVLIRQLLDEGATVAAYDPLAMTEAAKELGASADQVEFSSHQYDCLTDADALVLMTEWKPFRQPDFNAIGRLLRQKVIVDGRNQYDARALRQAGFEYRGVGRGETSSQISV